MEPKNTVLDDICAEIGYTATTALVAWYGGTVLYIPRVANTDHPLCKLLGMPAFIRLIKAFDGAERDVFIPKNVISERYERWRDIRKLALANMGVDAIAEKVSLSTRQVTNVCRSLEEHGLLPVTALTEQKHVD